MTNLHGVTWAVLLDGLLGGIIGTLGAFGAAALAILYDRRQRQRLELQRAADDRALRRRRAVGAFAGLLKSVETEALWSPILGGQTARALSAALVSFDAEVGNDYPEVRAWVHNRYPELVSDLRAWRRRWWLHPVERRRQAVVWNGLSQFTGVLTLWSTGRLTDAEVAATRFEQFYGADKAGARVVSR